jgi:type IV fimbrial biogenesis protein FimT
MMRRQNGLSTVELIVVMAIIAILTTLAYPQFKPDELSGATRMMHGDLQHARMLAVDQRSRVTVLFEVLNGSGETIAGQYKIHQDKNSDGQIDLGEVVTIRNLSTDYRGVTFNANRPAAVFYPQGTANSGTVTLTDGSDSKRVIFSWTGRIRISGPAS